ncbi:helix-turn-helix transcriptional regulator [Lactococcus raffinolactis]|nr:helix-turn-helix transcriptional regulator [Lactococcus raffinolactis]MDT2766515.1 helix-turn-helix transcriptional regulator [Lactococcus raffinolactis]MDT2789675.1 helix-turn-helix transcriptional regulator [Lactococcus raffinolactis]
MVETNLPPKITLRAARTNAGYSAKEVGEKIGKHHQTILNYEKDSTDIPRGLLVELSNIYRYPIDFIFLGKTYCLNGTPESEHLAS